MTENEPPKSERPKLNLIPRTLPVVEDSSAVAAANASIFGSAKPVDTSAREREIEEKLKKERALALEKEKQLKAEQEAAGVEAGVGALNLTGDDEIDAKSKTDEVHHDRHHDQECKINF